MRTAFSHLPLACPAKRAARSRVGSACPALDAGSFALRARTGLSAEARRAKADGGRSALTHLSWPAKAGHPGGVARISSLRLATCNIVPFPCYCETTMTRLFSAIAALVIAGSIFWAATYVPGLVL